VLQCGFIFLSTFYILCSSQVSSAVAEQKLPEMHINACFSEYIMTAQDKVGCLTADGNVDDVDLHRALKHIKINWPLVCRGVCRGWVMRVS